MTTVKKKPTVKNHFKSFALTLLSVVKFKTIKNTNHEKKLTLLEECCRQGRHQHRHQNFYNGQKKKKKIISTTDKSKFNNHYHLGIKLKWSISPSLTSNYVQQQNFVQLIEKGK